MDGVAVGAALGDFDKPGCYGLTSMRERAVILEGAIAVGNIEPAKFAIRVSIPLDNPLTTAVFQ